MPLSRISWPFFKNRKKKENKKSMHFGVSFWYSISLRVEAFTYCCRDDHAISKWIQ